MNVLSCKLPDKYKYDFMVFQLSEKFGDEERIWRSKYVDVYKRIVLRNFSEYLKSEYYARQTT